ncbi:MAG: Gfo/Idh/MocA family oxidoreductase [Verrucomicrobiota bacterium]
MNNTSCGSKLRRRHFLAATGLAVTAPMIVPSSVFGADGVPAPSNRITMGVVGWGMQGPGNTGNFLREVDCQVVAVCDLDKKHLESAANKINGQYKNQDCKTYHDFRELMARKDIDTVMLAVPDHWHLLAAQEAAKNKKDIYGEKPLARTIAEQQAIVKAVQDNKRVWQTGSWQRSEANFHKAAEIVRNGMIGKLTRVEVGLPSGHSDFAKTKDKTAITQPPAELDYEFWIGPSKMEPYIEARLHKNWRWNYNTGGGQLLDWIGHHCDIAHWGMGDDTKIGPMEIEGKGEFPAPDAVWNTCTTYRITAKYPDNIVMTIAGGHKDIRGGTKWIGTDGWVWVNRGGAFESSNPAWSDFKTLPEEQRKIKLIKTKGHYRNFLDCVKSRERTVAPVEVAHHSAIPGHLGLIAMLVGRKIKWDAQNEVIVGDAEASKLLTRAYRPPWKMA